MTTALPRVSVIMPIYNRAGSLEKTLVSLIGQTLPSDRFEVIIVDDGSDDRPEELLESLQVPYDLRFKFQENRGAAAARNLGAAHAQGEILLFLDSDMIAEPELLAEHLKIHDERDRVLGVGRRKPWPEARCSPVTRILDLDSNVHEGDDSSVDVSFEEAFTANLSFKRTHFAQVGGFDEEFRAYEDTDFAYRTTQLGFEVVFNPSAVAYHNHPMTLEQVCRSMRSYKSSSVLLLNKHPELRGTISDLEDKEPISLRRDPPRLLVRKTIRLLLAWRPVLAVLQVLVGVLETRQRLPGMLRFLYWKVLGSYQLIGFREGIQRYGW